MLTYTNRIAIMQAIRDRRRLLLAHWVESVTLFPINHFQKGASTITTYWSDELKRLNDADVAVLGLSFEHPDMETCE